ncbi:DNA polymerase III subunit delta' [Ferrimonas balearica]|uniref:DNA polymerase III subunit delta' n=1 Tax=Ferrimonas balearica TaxID=44012 RepID=UPI001C991D9D|nr:DNA polymerase III subunit delta' [Ferrimonas balearica]MBY5991564.1 DNA polymerase III subunit delta' [Ferrimonas balearica]
MTALLPWLQPVAERWLAQRQQQRLGHALLLQGPPGVGKGEMARWIAEQLLCDLCKGCGQCKSCLLLAAGHHPDLYQLAPEGQQIKVESVRQLIGQLTGTAHQGGARVAILQQAERMNTASANALLKTLEEPAPGVYLILVSDGAQPLLPTIVSRCQRLVVSMPSPDVLAAYLGSLGDKLGDWPYWPRILGGPLALKAALESDGLSEARALREAWQESLSAGLVSPRLTQVAQEQAALALKVLYFELLSQCGSQPERTAWLYSMLTQVAQQQRWLDRQSGINLTATFQQLIVDYQHRAQEGAAPHHG